MDKELCGSLQVLPELAFSLWRQRYLGISGSMLQMFYESVVASNIPYTLLELKPEGS